MNEVVALVEVTTLICPKATSDDTVFPYITTLGDHLGNTDKN